MGALLVVAFIATVFFVCGLILLFTGGSDTARKYGMVMVVIAITLGILCVLFHPKSELIPTNTWTNSYR